MGTGQESELKIEGIVNSEGVVWISRHATQVGVCNYAGLTSRLNRLQTKCVPGRAATHRNRLLLDLFGSDRQKVTGLWDFHSQRFMVAILQNGIWTLQTLLASQVLMMFWILCFDFIEYKWDSR